MKKSLLALAALAATFAAHAGPTFDTKTGMLTMTDVTVDGKLFFDNLNLKLNLATGTFELVSIKEKNKAISTTPLQTFSANNITIDFLGCARTGSTQVSCYVSVTNFNSDATIRFGAADAYYNNAGPTFLYDNLNNTYNGSVTVFGFTDTGSVQGKAFQGVPFKAEYVFDNINSRATSITAFEPSFLYYGTAQKQFTASFKNISF